VKPLLSVLVAAFVCACGGGSSTDEGAKSDPSTLYWRVQSVGAVPGFGQQPSLLPPHFVADGSLFYEDLQGVARLFKDGVDAVIPLPTSAPGGQELGTLGITWFEDLQNYGGQSLGNSMQLQGGWVLLAGKLHQCTGRSCLPMHRAADGSIVVRDANSQYWLSWKLGESLIPGFPILDAPDNRNAKLDIGAPCYGVIQVGGGGAFLLHSKQNGSLYCFNAVNNLQTHQIVEDFVRLQIQNPAFDRGFAVDITDCCFVNAINGKGQILGQRLGLPVIKTNETYETIDTMRGIPAAFNDEGDVLYVRDGDPNPRMRLKGETRSFSTCGILSQLGSAAISADEFTSKALDVSPTGQVAFLHVSALGNAPDQLFVATPRKQLYEPSVQGSLAFGIDGVAPAKFKAVTVTGSFSPSGFSLSMLAPDPNPCANRLFTAFGSRSVGEWKEGDLLPFVSSTSAGNISLGSGSFTDTTGTWIVSTGGARVSGITPTSFVLTLEGVTAKQLRAPGVLTITGSATIQR
jgi:hypothetical protein